MLFDTFGLPLQIPSDSGLNASVQVATTGVQTLVNCDIPPQSSIIQVNATNFTVTTRDSDGCSATGSFNPQDSEQQYGVIPTDPESCGFSSNTNVTVLPVVFWFFEFNGTDQTDPVMQTVMCRPQISLFDVEATVNYNNGSLINVQPLSNYTAANNISEFLGNGKALNG